MPSETVIVLKVIALAPAPSAPLATKRASSSMCTLQGVKLLQVEATPIWGLSKSVSTNPTARSIDRLGACLAPSTTTREYRRESTFKDFFRILKSLSEYSSLRNAEAFDQVPASAAQRLRLCTNGSAGAIFRIPRE